MFDFTFQIILLAPKAAIISSIVVHALELCIDILKLGRQRFFLLPHIVHHTSELLFALDSGLLLHACLLIIATSELVAQIDLSLLTDRRLSFFAAFLESFDALALKLSDWTIIKEVQRLAHEDQLTSEASEHSSARVIQQADGDDGRQARDEGHNVIFVFDMVVFQVEMRQLWEFSELLTISDRRDTVMREVKRLELHAVFETFNSFDLIVRQVKDDKFGEERQVFHTRDLVLVQVEAPHAHHVVETLDLVDTIAFEPNRLDFGISLEIFKCLEALVVEVQLGVADWGRVLAIELTYRHHIVVCKLVSALFVLFHDGVLRCFEQSCQPWES